MPTSKEYRHRAGECLRLANETKEIFARMALLELVTEFRAIAQQLELRERRANTKQRSSAAARIRPWAFLDWTKALIQSASYPRSASSIDPDLRRDKSAAASLLSCASLRTPGIAEVIRAGEQRMYALPQKRTKSRQARYVRFVPIAT